MLTHAEFAVGLKWVSGLKFRNEGYPCPDCGRPADHAITCQRSGSISRRFNHPLPKKILPAPSMSRVMVKGVWCCGRHPSRPKTENRRKNGAKKNPVKKTQELFFSVSMHYINMNGTAGWQSHTFLCTCDCLGVQPQASVTAHLTSSVKHYKPGGAGES